MERERERAYYLHSAQPAPQPWLHKPAVLSPSQMSWWSLSVCLLVYLSKGTSALSLSLTEPQLYIHTYASSFSVCFVDVTAACMLMYVCVLCMYVCMYVCARHYLLLNHKEPYCRSEGIAVADNARGVSMITWDLHRQIIIQNWYAHCY